MRELPEAIVALCRQRIAEAEASCQCPLRVRFRLGSATEFPLPRNMAFCTDRNLIVLAPRLVASTVPTRVDAVFRHELGHAIENVFGEDALTRDAQQKGVFLPAGAERRADALAQHIWGIPIRYDADTIQSLCAGVSPRPVILGV